MRLQLLAQKQDLPEGVKEALAICKNQLDRIVKFTEDLGQFSRSSSKHIAMNNVNEIIQHTLLLSDPQFKEYDISTDVNYDAALPLISLDKDRIEQVIFNLVCNATEAMAGRETRVLGIKTGLSASEGYVQVIISDTGTGIEDGHTDKVFDPFFTTKDAAQGWDFSSLTVLYTNMGVGCGQKTMNGEALLSLSSFPLMENINS
jgi:C4-dicarboxylate-specific signal transduction histidine kinase